MGKQYNKMEKRKRCKAYKIRKMKRIRAERAALMKKKS